MRLLDRLTPEQRAALARSLELVLAAAAAIVLVATLIFGILQFQRGDVTARENRQILEELRRVQKSADDRARLAVEAVIERVLEESRRAHDEQTKELLEELLREIDDHDDDNRRIHGRRADPPPTPRPKPRPTPTRSRSPTPSPSPCRTPVLCM